LVEETFKLPPVRKWLYGNNKRRYKRLNL
jgi:hypothetical protein